MKNFIIFLLVHLQFTSQLMSSLQEDTFFIAKNKMDFINHNYDIQAERRTYAMVEMMNKAQNLNERDKLTMVNSFFNYTPYESDLKIWGENDYWSSRLEFIGVYRADCEDYVIAKYITLKDLGIESSKLFFAYVMYKKSVPHMVLIYYETPHSIPLILDNYINKIHSAKERKDLMPIYSFNGEELLHAQNTKLGRLLPAAIKQTKGWDGINVQRRTTIL